MPNTPLRNAIVASATISCVAVVFPSLGYANECAQIPGNEQRLACYDALFRIGSDSKGYVAQVDSGRSSGVKMAVIGDNSERSVPLSKMTADWDLSPDSDRGAFEIRKYKPVYILLGTRTDKINSQPHSGNTLNNLTGDIPGLNATESQFQLSLKTKILSNIFGDNGNLWVGYTQSSRWQIYSGSISRPFRETNYEPEAILMFNTPYSIGNWKLRMSGIGVNHQSNGRANPLSRSWNRVIGYFGIENDDLSIQIRPWIRLKEDPLEDNNPGIENYVGRGEVIVAQRFGEHVISMVGRHSLRSGENSRGSLKLDWAIPIVGNLKGHLSLFSGYGESLIDYNHRQTMIGAGFSLVEW